MWVIPSRSRPENIKRMLPLVRRAILMIDEDDPLLGGYFDLDLPSSWQVRVGPRDALSAIYNRVYEEFPLLPWYGIFADDVEPLTPNWDVQMVKAAGSDGLSYGDDGIGAPTHFCLGGDLVRAMGWLAYPGLERLYIDSVWADIARQKGVLRYLPDVRVLHRHPSVGLALMDTTYRKARKEEDRALYQYFKETA